MEVHQTIPCIYGNFLTWCLLQHEEPLDVKRGNGHCLQGPRPLFVSVLDAVFLGREYPSMRSWGALLLIALGALGYALTDVQFQEQGLLAYLWPTIYLVVISLEMAIGKKLVNGVDLKTLSGPVLY
ncbi:hypothetical protein THAOC_22312, partial [Thalassiosira oceanica]